MENVITKIDFAKKQIECNCGAIETFDEMIVYECPDCQTLIYGCNECCFAYSVDSSIRPFVKSGSEMYSDDQILKVEAPNATEFKAIILRPKIVA